MSVESNRMLLKHHLEKLRLPTIRREWESAAAACATEGSDYGDFLLRLTERELIEREYKNIGFLGGPEKATSSQDRLKGFLEETVKHPELKVSHSFADDYSFQAGRAEMLRLAKFDRADAYFCGDDVLSIGVLSAIKDLGLSVPDDIGIIGFNDMEMAGWENIALTTIHQPIKQIINSSVELMEAMLDEPDRYPEARIFPCRIIERGTLKKG